LKPVNILFLCTHNSARSVPGEALATTLGKGKVVGYSAGSTPKTSVNPIARSFTDTFVGIQSADVMPFIIAQFLAALVFILIIRIK